MQIGPYRLGNPLILAPMAGVTDLPFRLLCRQLGAGMAVGEMLSANPALRGTEKTRQRMDHAGESGVRAIQIAGADPVWMADAAQFNVENGAQLIDINMGCPAKKVCNKYAGSALMAQPELALQIVRAVVNAVPVPVSLKMRSGISAEQKNALALALGAEDAGVVALTVHGRTRDQFYSGSAEYETVRAVKQAVAIPVIANGDIDTPERARHVLDYTGCDGLMIGRAAHGNPWIFREMDFYLQHGRHRAAPDAAEVEQVLQGHIAALHAFYGDYKGLRIARKHVGWYLAEHCVDQDFRAQFNALETGVAQRTALRAFFSALRNDPDSTSVHNKPAAKAA